jgi:(p)ppGpp synthase/HD superfamily hydrolase
MYSVRVDRALALAAEDFRHRPRKGTDIPYLAHLLQVAVWVAEHGGDEDQIVAALLHDWIEDIPGADPARLEAEFGPRVRSLVEALSDSDDAGEKAPWRDRKERYLAHLRDAPADVKLVSASDKLHNARSILRDLRAHGDDVWRRFRAGRDGQLWYYAELVVVLRHGWSHPLVDELEGVVAEIEAEVARTAAP